MPNHVHGIIVIAEPTQRSVGAQHDAWPDNGPPQIDTSNPVRRSPSNHAAPLRPAVEYHLPSDGATPARPFAVDPGSLGAIVRAFKSRTAKRINRLSRSPNGSVWQRNYYEHIIRNEKDLARIRQYIIDNPAKWAEDADNPANWPNATP